MLFKVIKVVGLVLIANAITFFLSSSCIAAESITRDLFAAASVVAKCTINTTPVNFGTYNPLLNKPVIASGTITVTCTKGTNAIVSLSDGKNGIRRMQNEKGAYLTYELYKPSGVIPGATCAYIDRWGTKDKNQGLSLEAALSKDPRTYNVCGQISATADNARASVGHYTDVVLATMEF